MALPTAKPSLLVVDDVEDNRVILARRFTKLGYDVEQAEDGAAALDAISKTAFDIVLLDIVMPGMDGLEVLRRVRESYAQERLPIIMVSARTASEDVVEALLLGANDYVTKPVDLAVAHARVAAQVGLKRRQDHLRGARGDLEAAVADLQGAIDEFEGRKAFERGAERRELAHAVRAGAALTAMCDSPDLRGAVETIRRELDQIQVLLDGPAVDRPRTLRIVSHLSDTADRQTLHAMLGDAAVSPELFEATSAAALADVAEADVILVSEPAAGPDLVRLARVWLGQGDASPAVVVCADAASDLPQAWIRLEGPLSAPAVLAALARSLADRLTGRRG